MNKRIKQFVAVLSAIALIISSVTVYKGEGVKAADDGFTDVTGPMDSTYSYMVTDNTLAGYEQVRFYDKIYMQIKGSGDSHMDTATVTINGSDAGAVWFDKNAAIAGFNVGLLANNQEYEIKLTGTGGSITIILRKGDVAGSGGGGGETQPQPSTYKFQSEDNLVKPDSAITSSSNAGADDADFGKNKIKDRSVEGNSRWAANSGAEGWQLSDGEWIYVDLGDVYNITGVTSLWDNIPANGYSIYYATDVAGDSSTIGQLDETVWTKSAVVNQMPEKGTSVANETVNEVSLTGVTARYIMFYMNGYPSKWGASIWEIAVFGTKEAVTDGWNAPSSAILYNLTNGNQDYKAMIKDENNTYDEGVTPSYTLYVNDVEVKSNVTDLNNLTISADEMAAAGLKEGMNTFSATVTADKDGESKTSGKSSATTFYYKENEVNSSYDNKVAKIFVSTSRTSSTKNHDLYNSTQKEKIAAGLVATNADNSVEKVDSGSIKLRGNSTALAAKKAYNITFDNAVDLFGFGLAKKYSLLANAFDKTLLRNQIAMDFQRALEKDTTPEQVYTSNCKTVDFYLDGKYMGTYTLIESVETGDNRVEIDDNYLDENDNIQDGNNGKMGPSGMQVHDALLEIANDIKDLPDRYDTESYYFETGTDHQYFAINSPARNEKLGKGFKVNDGNKPTWVNDEIKAFVDAFETALASQEGDAQTRLDKIAEYIDVDSFVDFYITSEFFKTKDIAFSSTRFYIKDGKMYAGPLWDLDLSSGNANDDNATTTDFWAQRLVWFQKLMANDAFKKKVSNKYQSLQETIKKLYNDGGTVDQAVNEIELSANANYSDKAGWNLDTNYGSYNAPPIAGHTYKDYITDYKNWLKARNEWLLSMLEFEADYETNDNGETTEALLENEKEATGVSGTTWYDYTNYFNVSSSTDEVDADYGPKLAYDDNLETRWGTAASDNHWLQIDLGQKRPIREIDIIWETASAAGYTIEASDNPENGFTPIAVITGRTEVGDSQNRLDTITFDNDKEYQYIRINCQSRATNYGFSIRELAIYGPDEQFDDEVVDDGAGALTADKADLSVEGFQIQANDEHNDGYVNFRTVCKAPNIGKSIDIGGTPYTVKAYGTIYALDFTNTSGDHNKDNIKVYHTMLAKGLQNIEGGQAYLGANTFGGENRTYGYEATPIGTINGWDPLDANHTYYSRTMTKMDKNMANTIYVRAFVVTDDNQFIYSEDTAEISVAEIADYLYENSMSKNVVAHEYLFNNILHNTILQEAGSKYYRYDAKEYGWNGSLYTPQNSMFS